MPKVKPHATICECGEHAFANTTKGHVVFVDADDHHILAAHKWTASERPLKKGKKVYVYRMELKPGGVQVNHYLHRKIRPTDAPTIDHKDGDGLNNRKSNLRDATIEQNAANKTYPSSKSGIRGVFRSSNGKYRAVCRGKHLGTFDCPHEAARTYDAEASRQFGEFAVLNMEAAE